MNRRWTAGLLVLSGLALVFSQANAQTSLTRRQPSSVDQLQVPENLLQQSAILEQRNIELLSAGAVDPETYVLGPGDLLGLEIIGAYSLSTEDIVSADGTVTFPQLGTVQVAGLTLAEARTAVAERGARVVRGTDLQVVLKNTRAFKVYATGKVMNPGAYRASATMRVSELIVAAGGAMQDGSLRRIKIATASGDTLRADLLPFMTRGELPQNPLLIDGAVVIVEPRGRPLTLAGALDYPGTYDFVPGDNLADLVRWVGLSATADKNRIVVQRFQDASRWDTLRVQASDPMPLQPLDRILVGHTTLPLQEAPVTVLGAVVSPGPVPVPRSTLRVGDVIDLAGGPLEGAVLQRAVLVRAFIPDSIRVNDPTSRRSIAENLNTYRYLDTNVDLTISDGPLVEPGDVVSIPYSSGFVQVLGQVKRPGFYDYQPEWEPHDYIEAAGGWAKQADKSQARITRGRHGQAVFASDIDVVAPGDLIWVPEKPPGSFWDTVRNATTLVISFATLYLLIQDSSK